MELREDVILIEVAGEGGGVTILGRRNADGSDWKFAMKIASDNWLLLEEDETPDPQCKEPPLEWTGSWDAAIGLIGGYPWAMLIPLVVHSIFKEDVLVKVMRRLTGDHAKYVSTPEDLKKRAMERWQSKCRLAAVQWPERRLVFDDGPIFDMIPRSAETLEEVA